MFDKILFDFYSKYGFFIIGGAMGALVHRTRRKMSFLRFLKFLLVAILVALASGIVARDYFNIPETVTYVICGVFGAFSEDLLNEIEELIHSISEIVKTKLGVSTTTHNDKMPELPKEDSENLEEGN